MRGLRKCSKSNCAEKAVVTLSYNYSEQIATLAHLQQYPEPHTYDLCQRHSERLTVPRGWTVITTDLEGEPSYQEEDFSAIAAAVREVVVTDLSDSQVKESAQPELGRRGHLRAL
ncbi:MAG: DUF3499 domain-containing protein [Candidatus Nanopelagicaceae bacterium]